MGWRVGDIMEAQDGVLKTGTSTVGITFNGGVVVGADHRATMGHFIANKSVQKLFKIGDNLALTTAGLVGHAQSLSRTLAAEVSLFELRRGQNMTVKGAATFTANILRHCHRKPTGTTPATPIAVPRTWQWFCAELAILTV